LIYNAWEDGSLLNQWSYPFEISARTSNLVTNLSISDIISGFGERNSGFFHLTLWDGSNNEMLSSNNYYLTSFTDVDLKKPAVSFSNPETISPFDVSFTVSTNCVTPFAYLQSNYSGFFSDNGFMLLPKENVSITFHSVSEITLSAMEFLQTLKIQSLFETYH